VANSPSFEDTAVLAFFEASRRNLLTAEAAAGVGHHVALSVVGADRLLKSGYFRRLTAGDHEAFAALFQRSFTEEMAAWVTVRSWLVHPTD